MKESDTSRRPERGHEGHEQAYVVRWEGTNDPDDPKSDARSIIRKWSIALIVSSSALCVTCASLAYTAGYGQLQEEFGVSHEVIVLGLTLVVVGLALGPLFLAPLSEFYGRRPIYLVAFGMYLIWLIPCAVARNTATMMVSRFIDGLAGSAFLSVAGGTIGDIFPREHLGAPKLVFSVSPFLGPSIGPVFSNPIAYYTTWRWIFRAMTVWAGIQWLMIVAFVPETYAPVLLRNKAVKMRISTRDEKWRAPIELLDRSISKTVLWSCIRPFQLLLHEQMCLNLALLAALLLGVLYLFFGESAFALVFTNNHDFNLWQVGLTFSGILVGTLIGSACDPIIKSFHRRLVRRNGGVSEPEFRLVSTIGGAFIVPLSLSGFGWTTFRRVHWVVPIVFSGFFGLGNSLCFGGILTFLVECYPTYAASALAANTFVRSMVAAAFPLFGDQMYNKLGYQWATSLLAFLGIALAPFPLLFFFNGKQIRSKSKFAKSN